MRALTVRVEDLITGKISEYAFVRSPVHLGRSSRNELRLTQPGVSGKHAQLTFDEQDVQLTDLGSSNGTSVGGALLRRGVPVRVAPGITVEIERYRLTFTLQGSPRQARAAAGVPTAVLPARPLRGATSPAAPSPDAQMPPGRITALLQRLAVSPQADDLAWQQALFPGARLGRFELIREVGRGGCGVVYQAKDTRLGREVALKALRPGRRSQVQAGQARLQREAEAVASMSHPNVVSLHDAAAEAGLAYLVFELLRGESLRQRLASGRVAPAQALEISIQVAKALDHAHALGIVHCDVKPSNVFLCHGGAVKVLDFGLAQVLGHSELRQVGTPGYMAPEQWRDQPLDARADVFAAAVMLYELLAGHPLNPPDPEGLTTIPQAVPPPLPEHLAAPALWRLLASGLEPDRALRPSSGREWLAGLQAAAQPPSMG